MTYWKCFKTLPLVMIIGDDKPSYLGEEEWLKKKILKEHKRD